MKKTLVILISAILEFCSCGQNKSSIKDKVSEDVVGTADTIRLDESRINTPTSDQNAYYHTEADYTDSNGKGFVIENGFPRGGGMIYQSNDMPYGHAVFWSRVVNKTDAPAEITIEFPADSIVIFPSSNAHFKLLVPPDTMTLDKVSEFSYGLKNVKTFVESNFHQPSQIQRTIRPNEDCIFYVVLLSYLPPSEQGVWRTGLFLDGQKLFYRLTVDASTSELIPCGQINTMAVE